MRRPCLVLVAALVLGLIYGCATDYPVYLQPAYPTGVARENSLAKVKPPLRFAKGTFTDKRSDPTILVRFVERVYTHTLRARRPLDDILFEGLGTMVKNAGHTWGETGSNNVRVDMQLLEIQASGRAIPIAGVVGESLTASASSIVQTKLDFVNPHTGELVYSQIYTARNDRSAPGTMAMLDKVTASIGAAMVVLMNNVSNDEQLAAALKKVGQLTVR